MPHRNRDSSARSRGKPRPSTFPSGSPQGESRRGGVRIFYPSSCLSFSFLQSISAGRQALPPGTTPTQWSPQVNRRGRRTRSSGTGTDRRGPTASSSSTTASSGTRRAGITPHNIMSTAATTSPRSRTSLHLPRLHLRHRPRRGVVRSHAHRRSNVRNFRKRSVRCRTPLHRRLRCSPRPSRNNSVGYWSAYGRHRAPNAVQARHFSARPHTCRRR